MMYFMATTALVLLSCGAYRLRSSAAQHSIRRQLSTADLFVHHGKIHKDPSTSPRFAAPSTFNFIHVPKTAGSSFIVDSGDYMPVGTILQPNDEGTFVRTPGKPANMVVLLREPMTHVVSQFMECKYDGHFKRHSYHFPGRNTGHPSTYYKLPFSGFAEWVQHFLNMSAHQSPRGRSSDGLKLARMVSYNCYNPWNMQARYLTAQNYGELVHEQSGHYVMDTMTPSLTNAKKVLDEIGLVLIKEHYDASLCLLEFRALGYLTPHCTCAGLSAKHDPHHKHHGHHIRHGVPKHSINDVDAKIVHAMRSFVEVDTALYAHALARFKAEVRDVYAATGVDLLCEEKERKTGFREDIERDVANAILQVEEGTSEIVEKIDPDMAN